MAVFSIIFPLIFVVFTGYISARSGFLSAEQLKGLSRFVFYIAIPTFLFSGMAQAPLRESLDAPLMLSFYLPVVACYLLLYASARRFAMPRDGAATLALGGVYSNTMLVGLPVIIAALGKESAALVFIIITFHSALLFALTFLLSSGAGENSFRWRRFAADILLNPIVASISLGIVFNLLAIKVPPALQDGLVLLSTPAIAGALFVLGANLTLYKVSDKWMATTLLTVVKLALLPACVYVTAQYVFSLEQAKVALVTLLSASPLGVNAYLVANQIGQQQSLLAGNVVISTLASAASFSLWLLFLL